MIKGFLLETHFFKESVGRHDLYSGSLVELRKSVFRLMSLPPQTKIYPGHDDPSTIRYELKHNSYYIKWAKQNKKIGEIYRFAFYFFKM